jgi:predicted short-subunit dehydrogenase-like oxidoreductase (DUF2520 family)
MNEVGLIGPGRVGRSLAMSLPPDLYRLGPVRSRTVTSARKAVREMRLGRPSNRWADFAACSLILVATPEAAIAPTLDSLLSIEPDLAGVCVLHTSGFFGLDWDQDMQTRGASFGWLFPVHIFQRPSPTLNGVPFVLGGNRQAVRVARRLVRACGAKAQVSTPDGKNGVAAGLSLASDALTGIYELTLRRFTAAGFGRRRALDTLNALVLSSFDGYARSGKSSKPGPLTRGDHYAVLQRALSLESQDPDEAKLYRRTLDLTLDILGRSHEGFDFLSSSNGRARTARAGSSDGG